MATGEPIGQLLIAMVGARQQNAEMFPLYGCYVLGRNWFFVVLDEQQYAVSKAFDATQDDIFGIYSAIDEVQQRVTGGLDSMVKRSAVLISSRDSSAVIPVPSITDMDRVMHMNNYEVKLTFL